MIKRALAIFFLICLASCNEKSDEILIGEVESMGGTEAAFGVSTHHGIEMAVSEINAAGGIKGRKLRLVVADDQGKGDETALAATKLITQDHVIALISGGSSSRMLAMAPIAQSHRVPFIATGATNPKVTEQGDCVFRTTFIDPVQGEVMAKFAAGELHMKTVAILKDLKSDYSIGLADFFRATFEKGGGKVVATQTYNAGEVDFKSQLTSIMARHPDGIFLPGFYTEVALIARQAKELGNRAPLFGGDGWDSPKLKEIAGTALAGGYFSSQYSPESSQPRALKFIADFKTRFGFAPDASSALGYDGTHVLADAISRAPLQGSNEPTSAAVRDALAATKGFQGATGNIRINEKRDAVKPAVIIRVDPNGDFKFHSTVEP